MLAYRHSFHAGNHADVLKHMVQVAVQSYLNEKDKPYWVVDTHAGAGSYALGSTHAQRNAEFESGVARVWRRRDMPPLLEAYAEIIRRANPGELAHYPGSPRIARQLMRSGDKLRLFELHKTDYALLAEAFLNDRSTVAQFTDGFEGLKSCLPPPTRRSLVLLDPPYELKEDYWLVFNTVKDALERFGQGVVVLWYPVLNRPEPRQLVERLERLKVKWLNVSMQVREPDADGFGLLGSGVFVINPPYLLKEQLGATMPFLTRVLSQFATPDNARFTLDSFEPK